MEESESKSVAPGPGVEELRAQNRWLVDAVEGSPLLMVALDDDGRYVAMSDSALRYMERGRDEVIGQPIGFFLGEERRQQAIREFADILEAGVLLKTIRVPDRRGGATVEFESFQTANVAPGIHVSVSWAGAMPEDGDQAGPQDGAIGVVVGSQDEMCAAWAAGMVAANPAFEVLAACGDPERLAATVLGHRPDIVFFAASPGMAASVQAGGAGLIEPVAQLMDFIAANEIDTRVCVMNYQDRPNVARDLLALGVAGVHGPADTPDGLLKAMLHVAEGQTSVSPMWANRLSGDPDEGPGAMTARELEVLRLVALGYTNREVAEELHLSPRTVEGHRSAVNAHIGSESRRDLVAYALGNFLIP